jgi:NAD(P)-dependent dehydrogenase (short-subunit alcohol dehydrogenase family)
MNMKTPSALITGVGRGFGLELARRYCEMGWRVFGVLRTRDQGAGLSSEFGEAFVPILADLRDDTAVKTIQLSLEENADDLSLLVNNAGIAGSGHSITDTSCSEIIELLDVHCCGAIRCLQAALPFLKKGDHPTVVNVSSRVGSIGKVSAGELDHLPLSYSIRIAKSAQNMLSAAIYRELSGSGIAVFAVHPGRIQTRMGSPDAGLTAEQAAGIFIDWLPKIRQERSFGYFEAGGEALPF